MSPEEIVRELATCGEPLDREMGDCALCDAWDFRYNDTQEERLPKHADWCPWRMAVEWVAAQ
jgi:hypothetical protein